ncbi:MAG TPA: hypothetical protein VFH54_06010, partial [Mycobacteriales bacterium]|nr:hypothetical protein [Mycobacteriales bacterium]
MTQRPWRPIAALTCLVLLAVVVLLMGIGALATAEHPTAHGGSRGGNIALAVISVVMLAALIYAIVHLEHRIRHNRAVGSGLAGMPPPPFLSLGRRGSRRHGPVSMGLWSVVMVGGAVLMFVLAASTHTAADRSHQTQSHGLPTVAVVDFVQHVAHHGRYSTWYTARITVHEASGAVTVVHDPHDTDLGVGMQVQILVDPADSGYAEFPGQPAATTAGWVLSIVFGIGFLLFGGFGLR